MFVGNILNVSLFCVSLEISVRTLFKIPQTLLGNDEVEHFDADVVVKIEPAVPSRKVVFPGDLQILVKKGEIFRK